MAQILQKPTIAVISIGDMGLGITKLLMQHSYPVLTCLEGRSETTRNRADQAGIRDLPMSDLVQQSDIIISIVPPKDAMAMALAITNPANQSADKSSERKVAYMDLNAISPQLAIDISEVVQSANMTFVDGGILGYPPRLLDNGTWYRPALITSGPLLGSNSPTWAKDLISTLNVRHISDKIGSASGLKLCFGAFYKGQTAIAFQAYTTASNLGILPALQQHLRELYPDVAARVENSMLASQQKAYRWIREMEEMRDMFVEEGGWGQELFGGASDVFRMVNEGISGSERHSSVEKLIDQVNTRLR